MASGKRPNLIEILFFILGQAYLLFYESVGLT